MFDSVRRVVGEEMRRMHFADLGRVTDIHPADPDNYSCSVQLRDSGIMLKRVPVATPKLGLASIPAIGDLVLVEFIGGEIDAPVIIGSLYNNEDRPPKNDDGQWVLHLPLGAADADAAHVEVSSKDKRSMLIRMGKTEVTIQDDDPAIKIDVGGNAKLTIGSNGAIKIESSGNIELKAGGNMKLEAGGQMTIKGSTVNIN
jgi:phage baseplate assembly protein gpV